jgi:glycosyltransferase involved in cell wall biosynthesis
MKILAFAFSCSPGTGSEPGAGWAWSRMLARMGETWVVTRSENEAAVEQALETIPESPNLHFIYVDPPLAAKPLMRKVRKHLLFYYVLWQPAALRAARRLSKEVRFDLVWHLTYANVWLGSVAALVGPDFVYGPVGGGVGTSLRLMPTLGPKGAAADVLRGGARTLARWFNPLARVSWRRARLILVQNPDTRRWLPARHRGKTEVFPHVVLESVSKADARGRGTTRTALMAGRLMPWKGLALALKTIQLLPNWRLLVCGSGSDVARGRKLARKLDVEGRVEFLGWTRHEELLRLMAEEADVFLFPSIHDEAGWVVVEAQAAGLPVICLDRGGPPILGGHAVPATSPSATARALADAVETSPAVSSVEGYVLDARTRALSALLSERLIT